MDFNYRIKWGFFLSFGKNRTERERERGRERPGEATKCVGIYRRNLVSEQLEEKLHMERRREKILACREKIHRETRLLVFSKIRRTPNKILSFLILHAKHLQKNQKMFFIGGFIVETGQPILTCYHLGLNGQDIVSKISVHSDRSTLMLLPKKKKDIGPLENLAIRIARISSSIVTKFHQSYSTKKKQKNKKKGNFVKVRNDRSLIHLV